MFERVGAVAIGRNEGPRLAACLASLTSLSPRVAYVDSGSNDNSLEIAKAGQALVLNLDMSRPFTAARARNAGWQELVRVHPELEFIQFVDGDCTIDPNWLAAGLRALEANPKLAVVCGRLRERFPGRSIYNRLCDMEWDTPVGPTSACGGIALYRRSALEQVHGFDDRIIAGEEPELCVRLRGVGWEIERLADEMALHDAAMTRFGQWYRRAKRSGHAYAEGYAMHGRVPERHCADALRRILAWGIAWPLLLLALIPWLGWHAAWGLIVYPLQMYRTARGRRRSHGDPWLHCGLYGFFCTLAKFAEVQGLIVYCLHRARGRGAPLMDYRKTA